MSVYGTLFLLLLFSFMKVGCLAAIVGHAEVFRLSRIPHVLEQVLNDSPLHVTRFEEKHWDQTFRVKVLLETKIDVCDVVLFCLLSTCNYMPIVHILVRCGYMKYLLRKIILFFRYCRIRSEMSRKRVCWQLCVRI